MVICNRRLRGIKVWSSANADIWVYKCGHLQQQTLGIKVRYSATAGPYIAGFLKSPMLLAPILGYIAGSYPV